jgi:GT2 family glycosyltransferase
LTDISVVICIYTEERWDDFLLALESVEQQSAPPREIIVVVDHNPRLLELVRDHVSDVVIVENGEVHGLSGARNCGMRVARGSVIAFLDDDAVAAPSWLEELGAGYEDPAVIGVGGSIKPIWSDGRPGWFPREFDWVVGCTYRGMPSETTNVRNFLGCNMSFRREVFEAVGSFRNSIGRVDKKPLGCEETEFCIRALQYWPDKVLRYRPSARVYHRVPISRARGKYFLSRCYSEGLSKAMVARFVGAGDGLSSERSYTFKTLPRGGARGLKDTFLRGDLAGLGRTGAIVTGLASTTSGYVVGAVSGWAATMEKRLKRGNGDSG